MRVWSADDFQSLLDQLPATADNQVVYSRLMQMMSESKVIRQPYTFEVDFTTGVTFPGQFAAPAAGASVGGNFLVDTSAPFMLVSQTFKSDLAAAAFLSGTQVLNNQLVFIQDQSSNRNWMNFAVPVLSLFGTAQLPYFLPQPRLIPANTNVQITLSNGDAAAVPNTRLSFHGYRMYSTES